MLCLIQRCFVSSIITCYVGVLMQGVGGYGKEGCHIWGRSLYLLPPQVAVLSLPPFSILVLGGPGQVPLFDPTARSLQLMGLVDSCYIYWHDLHHLATATLSSTLVELGVPDIPSPIIVPHLAHCFASNPDPYLSAFLLQGLSRGIRVGESGRMVPRPTARNHPSCVTCLSAISSLVEGSWPHDWSIASNSCCARKPSQFGAKGLDFW